MYPKYLSLNLNCSIQLLRRKEGLSRRRSSLLVWKSLFLLFSPQFLYRIYYVILVFPFFLTVSWFLSAMIIYPPQDEPAYCLGRCTTREISGSQACLKWRPRMFSFFSILCRFYCHSLSESGLERCGTCNDDMITIYVLQYVSRTHDNDDASGLTGVWQCRRDRYLFLLSLRAIGTLIRDKKVQPACREIVIAVLVP